ncbi:hypothetical protein chiPu_0022644, partial [Chiloscyllium punctatum]|nr:hypothetical protein [Chiloscyllium punctatum]
QEAALIVRHIAMQKQRHLAFRDHRSYLLAQQVRFEADDGNGLVGTLKLSGYIRGQPLNVNRLVHIVGHGDFQMQQIDGSPDPMPLNPKTTKKREGLAISDPCAEMEEDLKVLMKADSRKQESLESEVVPDPMEGEQTWPTDEELQEAEDTLKLSRKIVRKVPKGTSDYQATWILDDEGDEEEESDEDMEKDEIMGETVSQVSLGAVCSVDLSLNCAEF